MNSPVLISNQNNPITTKLSKSLKKVMTNDFTLRNAMHPLMISLNKIKIDHWTDLPEYDIYHDMCLPYPSKVR